MSICCKPRSRGNRIRYHPDSVKSYRLSSRLQPISAGRRSSWNALHLAIFYFLNHHRTESDSRKFLKFPPKRILSYGKDKRRKRKEYDRYRHAYISQRTSRGVEGSRNVVRLYRRCLLERCQRSRFSVASCAAMRRALRPRTTGDANSRA